MFVKVLAGTLIGIDAVTVTVEANISNGIGMFLVGLPDSAVKESQERIRSAFGNCGYRMTGKKLVVNLAPADIRKEGAGYDLPIAVAILAASGQVPAALLSQYMIMGELSLDGTVSPIRGALSYAVRVRESGLKGIILPSGNVREASVVDGIEIIGVDNLTEVAGFLEGKWSAPLPAPDTYSEKEKPVYCDDLADVRGQFAVKRALEIAASGGHNILMIGSPGSGKTMLARRMPSILPAMSLEESLESTKIHSAAGKLGSGIGLITTRPFRSPHHLTSRVALVGGGANPQPGEISLAHNGILFLDELPEFGRNMLEVLRQPLEDKMVTVSRSRYTVEYPANFNLVGSMNPCPCGYYNHPTKECTCSAGSVSKYLNRISGPLLDRIDIHIEVTPVPYEELRDRPKEETSEVVRQRVEAARAIQRERFAGIPDVHCNAMMNTAMLDEFCPLGEECGKLLQRAMSSFNLSARAYTRIIKLSRTIADMDGSENIEPQHIAEAVKLRTLDREYWAN